MKRPGQPSSARTAALSVEQRKRLGQYFTGIGLGRVLAALARAESAKSIIDPMAGTGDLLAACLEVGARPDTLVGIEIDPVAHKACVARLPQATCILGSAFDPDEISRLPRSEWDLVIANPPYVRYQALSNRAHAGQSLPNAVEIRRGLQRALTGMHALDAEDKRLFRHVVQGYSGLSDLAVPSWILCAMLVKHGGHLALVVPESWLTRDYATVIHYLLLRWFDIEFVVEDEHASWFEDAQVKTTLIVARRVKRRASVLEQGKRETYCHIGISSAAASAGSPIGRMGLEGRIVERRFAQLARRWLNHASTQSTGPVRARPASMALARQNVMAGAGRQNWLRTLEGFALRVAASVCLPHEIHDWIARHGLRPAFETLDSQGVSVGQGLRTGANGFFYADGVRHGDGVALSFSGPLAGLSVVVPLDLVRPVLRRQSELPVGFVVSSEDTCGWVLDLRRHALPEDRDATSASASAYQRMPESLAHLVRRAARTNFGTALKPQMPWELTAVAPNMRQAARGLPARYWYMLPDFTPRHLPDVFLARVVSTAPKAYLNTERECLIDANFLTMWVQDGSRWSPTALLAIMNSAWTRAVLETSGAVMGGGALKIEATHLRRFPLPSLDDAQLRGLSEFGGRLATPMGDPEAVLVAVDALVAAALGCRSGGTAELRRIALAGQERRARHKLKRGS